MASGATCVQRLDDSRDSAIHTKYRILLRSSSMREPRYPLPRVVCMDETTTARRRARDRGDVSPLLRYVSLAHSAPGFVVRSRGPSRAGPRPRTRREGEGPSSRGLSIRRAKSRARTRSAPRGCCDMFAGRSAVQSFDNDPSAGSPTETLLRLLLPLNDKVQWTSRDVAGGEPPTSPRSEHFTGPFNR